MCVCVCLNFDVPPRKWIHWGEEKSWYRQKDDPWKWIPYLYVSIESITGKADFLLQWEGERECHILDLYIKKRIEHLIPPALVQQHWKNKTCFYFPFHCYTVYFNQLFHLRVYQPVLRIVDSILSIFCTWLRGFC